MHSDQDITPSVIEGIQERKGTGISVVDLSGIDMASTGKFVICEGRSPQQVSAIADSVREKVFAETGRKPFGYDGYRNSQWIVVDYGEVVVHVFVPETRLYYNLEELWADAPQTLIGDLD